MDPPILGRHKAWKESEPQKPGSDLEMGAGGPRRKTSGVGMGIHTVLLVQEGSSVWCLRLRSEFGLTSEFGMLVQRLHVLGGR